MGSGHVSLSAPELFTAVADRIRGEAAARDLAEGDVCTVLIVAVLPTRLAEDAPASGWVAWPGDVSPWQLTDGHWRIAAGDRKRGQGGIESNALSAVLPFDPAAAQYRELTFSVGDVFTLVTDGVGDGLAGLADLNRLPERVGQPTAERRVHQPYQLRRGAVHGRPHRRDRTDRRRARGRQAPALVAAMSAAPEPGTVPPTVTRAQLGDLGEALASNNGERRNLPRIR